MKVLIFISAGFGSIVASAQNVGIGTTTADDPLTVKSSNSGFGISQETADKSVRIGFFTSTSSGAFLQTHTNHDLKFATNNDVAQMVLQKATGNVGIGTQNPVRGGLVVDKKSGAVNALFGSNTSGVAIESDFPGIGFNTYYFQTRNNIASGFGALISLNPANGNFSIFNTAQTGVAGGLANLSTRLLINKDGNIGIQGNTNPGAPLSFSNTVGNKIALWGDPASGHYGVGVQGSLLQLYSGGPNDDIVFGHGRSGAFVENVRMKGNGNVGIGTTTPGARLHVQGSIRLQTGNEGAGRILTSDASGSASWKGPRALSAGLTGNLSFVNNTEIQLGPFTERVDEGNWFPSPSSSFTAPETGWYYFTLVLSLSRNAPSLEGVSISTRYDVPNSPFFQNTGKTSLLGATTIAYHDHNTLLRLEAGDVVRIFARASFTGAAVETLFGPIGTMIYVHQVR